MDRLIGESIWSTYSDMAYIIAEGPRLRKVALAAALTAGAFGAVKMGNDTAQVEAPGRRVGAHEDRPGSGGGTGTGQLQRHGQGRGASHSPSLRGMHGDPGTGRAMSRSRLGSNPTGGEFQTSTPELRTGGKGKGTGPGGRHGRRRGGGR